MIRWDWIGGNLDQIASATLDHLVLTVIAVGVGFAISLALGLAAHRRRVLYGPVAGIAGLLYTIPSLAAFAVLRPIFGLSLWTAVIPLTTYTLLILYRNTVAGLRAVPPEIHEAALGMGYTPRTRLLRVELPLAVPMIMAGVRLAAVTTIGLVTIAAVIGADKFGGFGQFITEGQQTSFPTKIYLGGVLSVLLAFTVDGLLVLLERRLTPWAHARAARA